MSGIAELVARRDLAINLVRVELGSRYRSTLLGLAWFILTPLIMTVVLTVVFTVVFDVGIPDYPVFVLAALLPWTFFQGALMNGTTSVRRSANLIKRARMPRLLLPIAAIGSHLVLLLISVVVLLALMLVLGTPLHRELILLPVAVGLSVLSVTGLTVAGAALNVPYRDVELLANASLRVLFYLSPVLYPLDYVPAEWRTLYLLNPMAGTVEVWRDVVLRGTVPALDVIAITVASSVALLVAGLWVFRRAEPTFEDFV
ncbi:MAG: ABC transporter permease [Chloroflexota bacterium]